MLDHIAIAIHDHVRRRGRPTIGEVVGLSDRTKAPNHRPRSRRAVVLWERHTRRGVVLVCSSPLIRNLRKIGGVS